MLIAILVLLIISLILNVIFYIKLDKANKKIGSLLKDTLNKSDNIWSTFEQAIK